MIRSLLFLMPFIFFATSFYTFESSAINKQEPKNSTVKTKVTPERRLTNAESLYQTLDFSGFNVLNSDVFYKAYQGFENLKTAGKLNDESHLLTICDFSLSSTKKRLWVIDLNEGKIVFNSLVAHGKNTGDEFAVKFSNKDSSLQSSLGFFVTETTYIGSNGYSLKLEGVDEGFNDAALRRSIVMHGADYVSENFIKAQNRIGRSWGCPAVPRELAAPIINTIKGKNCLFIYYPDEQYLATSKWLKG